MEIGERFHSRRIKKRGGRAFQRKKKALRCRLGSAPGKNPGDPRRRSQEVKRGFSGGNSSMDGAIITEFLEKIFFSGGISSSMKYIYLILMFEKFYRKERFSQDRPMVRNERKCSLQHFLAAAFSVSPSSCLTVSSSWISLFAVSFLLRSWPVL